MIWGICPVGLSFRLPDERDTMNFDYGNVLTRAWQITWRHKAIWMLVILSILPSFLLFPLFFLPIFLLTDSGESAVPGLVLFVLLLIAFIIVMMASYIVGAVASSSVTLGIVRAERGTGSLRLMDLLRDGLAYFWRILAIMLIVGLMLSLLFSIFSLISVFLILVTIGVAAICTQPLMILLTPLMFLMIGFMEAANTAVIADGMNAMDAIRRAWQIVRANIWKYVLITLIVYFGTSILTSFIMVPFMLPVFVVPFLLDGSDAGAQLLIAVAIVFACTFFPLMILVSSVTGTYMKTALDLTYLRLAAPLQHPIPKADSLPLISPVDGSF